MDIDTTIPKKATAIFGHMKGVIKTIFTLNYFKIEGFFI